MLSLSKHTNEKVRTLRQAQGERVGKTMRRIVVISILLNIAPALVANSDDLNQLPHGKTFLAPRSQSVNAARELVGWHNYINLYCQDGYYGAFSITPEYSHSFRPVRIAEYYFAVDTLVITGSQVLDRNNQTQFLADYFGLSPNYQSSVRMEPEIRTGLIDFDFYIGCRDYYFRIHVPFVWTKWKFKLYETPAPQVVTPADYPALYMDTGVVTPPAQSFEQAMAGGLTWGQVTQGIEYGKISGAQSKRGWSEPQLAIGWDFVNTPEQHMGINIRGSIPAGTRSDGIYLFAPIIGNGHHPELGAGFTGHWLLWEKDREQTIAIFTDFNMTHLFNSRQRRSFDLINPSDPSNNAFQGFATRYILAKEFIGGVYTGNMLPVIDITTLECDVSMAIQIDAAIMASYECCNYTVDLGYEVWFRSREMISNRETIPDNRYALKGIQNIGIATQSTATIYGDLYSNQAADADPFPPVYFNDSSIDESSAEATRGFTHKVFGNFSYSWPACSCYVQPFLGIGGEVEFEGLNPRHEIKANKNSISQWGIWLKGGLGF